MAQKFIEAQNEVIKKYRITICTNSTCWNRMHAHVKERKVCKWKQANSIRCTFDLFHEIGHIETHTAKMRRCESEYYATVWAMDRCKEYGLEVPESIIKVYQDYINMEHDRGVRRGGDLPNIKQFQLVKQEKKKHNTGITLKELRTLTGMSQHAFGDYFKIPMRTIQNWENGVRECNEYIIELIEYKLKNEGMIGKEE